MTLRNLRAYTPSADDTLTGVTAGNYATGNGENARLRKINLNVDIATQAELNDVYAKLSGMIQEQTSAYIPADQQLSNDLKDWAKGSELSGALHTEITTETTRATTAEEAIRADLSNNYKITIEKDAAPETSAYAASYTIKQGNTALTPKINIPKDYVVKDAALCTVTVADQPYAGAAVGDKYIDFTVNTAETDDPKHIYLPVKDLVDVYTGATTEDAVVSVGTDNTISVSLTDKIARVGTAQDLSTANTVEGAKRYADEVAAAVAVSAEGETGAGALVSADDANNMITVGSTQKLKDAVTAAERAVTYVEVDASLTSLITVNGNTSLTSTGSVKLNANDRLTAVVDKVEKTSADWDSAEADAKAYTNTVSAALSTSLHNELTTETQARKNADTALSNAIDALSGSVNGAFGDDYVAATVEDNKVKVSATDLTKGAVDKVVAASATWDSALQSVAGGQTTYITVTASAKDSNAQTISATALTHTVTDAVAGTADGLATASDVKGYVDGKITDLSVSAAGDAYVNATSTGKAITVTATDKLTAAVNAVETSADTWNAAAPLTALEAEQTARANADTALSTAIDALSATYASKTTVDDAATTLDGAAALTAKDLTAYNDIDEIIQELEDLKAAVKTFAGTLKTA